MRVAVRLLRPAANQNVTRPGLWQDPVFGYYEQHGKTRFLPNENYNLTDEEKKAVLWRYRVKEILKKEYLRREFDPHNFKYKEGVVMDPAMFRWYSADMCQAEYFRATPRSVFLYVGIGFFLMAVYVRLVFIQPDKIGKECREGKMLWWDRQVSRQVTTSGSGVFAPTTGIDF